MRISICLNFAIIKTITTLMISTNTLLLYCRHERLQSLLIKLRCKLFGDGAAEVPLVHISTQCVEQADEQWFFEQVKERFCVLEYVIVSVAKCCWIRCCSGGGKEATTGCCAQLLSRLPTSQALLVMRHAHFRLPALQKCVTLGAALSRKVSHSPHYFKDL